MRYAYTLENLKCACCADKMEKAIRKIRGVNAATVTFMTAKLTIEADEADIGGIEEQASAAVKKIESGCKIRRA